MRTTLKIASVAVALLLGGAATVWASDSCFQDTLEELLVGKGFALPAAGACRAFNGYFAGSNVVVNGTACGTSDGSTIRFTLQYSPPPTSTLYVAYALMSLTRSTLTGSILYCRPDIGSGGSCGPLLTVSKVPCPASRPLD
jgi:hypothetical protein